MQHSMPAKTLSSAAQLHKKSHLKKLAKNWWITLKVTQEVVLF